MTTTTETMHDHLRAGETLSGFTFTVTPDDLVAIATVAVAASSDDVTPIVTGVHLSATTDGYRAEATDRYRVAVMDLPAYAGKLPDTPAGSHPVVAGDAVVIPGKFLTLAAKSAGARDFRHAATLPVVQVTVARVVEQVGEHDVVRSERVTIADVHGAWSHTADAIRGNYPPLARLFPADGADLADTPAGVTFDPTLLAGLAAIRLPGDTLSAGKHAAWALSSCPRSGSDNSTKPTPLYAERTAGTVERPTRVRYLLQPKLVRR